VSTLSCESCQLGKHIRSYFPSSVSQRASSSFALVHSDIWGPSRIKSNLVFQYFVTFIDDYSRCTWVLLMKNRSKLFSIFQIFLLNPYEGRIDYICNKLGTYDLYAPA